jgi:hypothetical protein
MDEKSSEMIAGCGDEGVPLGDGLFSILKIKRPFRLLRYFLITFRQLPEKFSPVLAASKDVQCDRDDGRELLRKAAGAMPELLNRRSGLGGHGRGETVSRSRNPSR